MSVLIADANTFTFCGFDTLISMDTSNGEGDLQQCAMLCIKRRRVCKHWRVDGGINGWRHLWHENDQNYGQRCCAKVDLEECRISLQLVKKIKT
ncbi:hypothetical protein OK016_08560 [Vibrio chagasii]|nr:hypothetical protein [Vibrio chagasii]